MSKPKELDAKRSVIIAILFAGLLGAALTTGGCGKQMARMEANQVKLQAMIMANARQLSTVSSQVHTGQNETNQALAQIDRKADGINTNVRTVQDNQTQLRETIVAGNQQITGKMAQLEANQSHLKDGVAQVGHIAQDTNTAVGAVAKDQATLHRMVQSNKQELADSIALVAQDQQRTHAGIDQLQAADRSLAGQITGVAQQQEAMQQLAQDNNRQLVGHLTTLSAEQTALHNDLTNNTQTLANKLAILEQHQLDIQSVIDRVANTTDRTANDVTTMAATQVDMRQTQGTRYENLTGQLATVAQNQQTLQTGIGALDRKADRTTSQLTTLAAGQNTIQETMQANNTSVHEGLAGLSSNHETLRTQVQHLGERSDAIKTDLNTALTNQTTLQNTLAENSETFAVFAENQTALQHRVGDLHRKADTMTGQLSAVATDLDGVHDSVRKGNETMAAQVTTLAKGQHTLDAGISQLAEQTHQVAAGQTTLRQAIQNHDEATREQMAAVASDQDSIRQRVDTVMATASQIALNLVTMSNRQSEFAQEVHSDFDNLADNQEALATSTTQIGIDLIEVSEGQNRIQEAIGSGVENLSHENAQLATDVRTLGDRQSALNETLSSHDASITNGMAKLAQTQGQIHSGLDAVAATTTQVALDVITLDANQTKLEQTAQADRAKLDTRLTDVAKNQRQMQTGLDTLASTTTQVALDVLTLDDKQAEQSRNVAANHDELVAKLTAAAEGQQQMQGSLETITATAGQIGLDVIALDGKQDTLTQAIQANRQEFGPKLTTLADNQQLMQGSLDTITATAGQLGLDVIALDGKQDTLAQAVQANRQEFGPKLTTLADNQQLMQGSLDTITATAGQIGLDVIALDGKQDTLAQAVQSNRQEFGPKLTTLADNQQLMQGSLDTITATAGQIGLDVIALDGKQDSVAQAMQANRQELDPKLATLAENQQQMATGLETLTATTTQVALDVLTLNDSQSKQGQALKATQQELASQIETVAQGQQQMQGHLDTVTATTSQVALDVITLDENQDRIEQAVQANRQELAAKLTEIAQGQQQWLARFDAAEAKVASMTNGITALEQRVSKLQGTLQTSLQDLSTLLDTESQQRVQFQDSVRQDMQSVTDSIAQLREIQAGLAEHIQRVQDSTQNRTGDILSALEQLQQKTNTEASDVDTELKSSKATPQEVMLP